MIMKSAIPHMILGWCFLNKNFSIPPRIQNKQNSVTVNGNTNNSPMDQHKNSIIILRGKRVLVQFYRRFYDIQQKCRRVSNFLSRKP